MGQRSVLRTAVSNRRLLSVVLECCTQRQLPQRPCLLHVQSREEDRTNKMLPLPPAFIGSELSGLLRKLHSTNYRNRNSGEALRAFFSCLRGLAAGLTQQFKVGSGPCVSDGPEPITDPVSLQTDQP